MQKRRSKKGEFKLHESFRHFRDILVSMIPLVGLSVYLYGLRPLILLSIAAITAILCDVLAALMRKRRFDPTDVTSLTFAVMLTFMLPASSSYVIVILGTAVAILLGKHAFGGTGNYPFHPAAFGFAFIAICRPDQVFNYPKSFEYMSLGIYSRAATYNAPAATLKLGGIPLIDEMDLLIGDYPGPMGATFCLVILASMTLLIAHRTLTWHVPVSCLAAAALYAYVFPRIPVSNASSVVFELVAGAVIFSSVYIASEPYTSPSNSTAKLIYGCVVGIVTMLFSHYGSFQVGSCFSVLLLSPLSSWLDRRFAVTRLPAKEDDEYEV